MGFFNKGTPDSAPTPAPKPSHSTPAAKVDTTRSRSAVSSPQKASPPTCIAHGSRVVGEVTGDADLLVEGVVEGEINLRGRVTVGNKGSVQGRILATSVEVAGRVTGNIQGREKVEVLASGSLEGDVIAPRVPIADGAFFKGQVEMRDIEQAAKKPAKKPAGKPAKTARNDKPGSSKGGQNPGNSGQPMAKSGGQVGANKGGQKS